ncbi:hypothetical protein MKZ26_07955 [Sporosarcina sp. FSL K6-6792]|uniref:hypothetical protein n=1 Tax=Sporosarcina sp. FSL K6-6792 TaxID=2921559 RepID=UPI0030F8D1BE
MRKIIITFLLAVLTLTTISSHVAEANFKNPANDINMDKLVNGGELTNELDETFDSVIEQAIIYDEAGNIKSFDFEVLKENFGSSAELDELQLQLEQHGTECYVEPEMTIMLNPGGEFPDMQETVRKQKACFEKKLVNNYKDYLGLNAVATVWEAVKSARYRVAADVLIKNGAKTNANALGISLGYYYVQCAISN